MTFFHTGQNSRFLRCAVAGAPAPVGMTDGDQAPTTGMSDHWATLYYANGGILQYVLRQLLAAKPSAQTVGV